MGEDKRYGHGNLLDDLGITKKWEERDKWIPRLGKRVADAVKAPFEKDAEIPEGSKKKHTTSYEDTAAYGRKEEGLPGLSTAFIEEKKKKTKESRK